MHITCPLASNNQSVIGATKLKTSGVSTIRISAKQLWAEQAQTYSKAHCVPLNLFATQTKNWPVEFADSSSLEQEIAQVTILWRVVEGSFANRIAFLARNGIHEEIVGLVQ